MKKIQFFGNKNIISDNVRVMRVKAKLSQGELAAKMQTMGVNIDQQGISRIENNERFVCDYELMCLCKIFEITADEMLSDI